MTVESAQRILAAAPQSAQARTDTALDRLMETAQAHFQQATHLLKPVTIC
jgi:hypothetical protein